MEVDLARYRELVDLARTCAHQARVTRDPAVANELRRMAEEYRQRAAEFNDGKLPDIGDL